MLLSPQVGNSKHLDSAFCVCVCWYLSSSLVSCTGNEATVVVGLGGGGGGGGSSYSAWLFSLLSSLLSCDASSLSLTNTMN